MSHHPRHHFYLVSFDTSLLIACEFKKIIFSMPISMFILIFRIRFFKDINENFYIN